MVPVPIPKRETFASVWFSGPVLWKINNSGPVLIPVLEIRLDLREPVLKLAN
jgi:hypothetical protein